MKPAFDANIELTSWSTFHERPVLDAEHDRILVAGGSNGALSDDEIAVLASCDRHTGVVRAMTFVDDVRPEHEVSTSLPLVLPDGRAAIAAYAKDHWLKLLVVDPQLRVERATTIGASGDDDAVALHIVAHD